MTTVLQYLVIAAVIGLVLFGIALMLFGRGEQMSALPSRTSPAQLPNETITGADVRRVRFALAVRGYRMSDVDWTLDRLADELDAARKRLGDAADPELTTADLSAPSATPPTDSAVDLSAPDSDELRPAGRIAQPASSGDESPNPDPDLIPLTDGDVYPAGTARSQFGVVDHDAVNRPAEPAVNPPAEPPRADDQAPPRPEV